MKTNIVLGGILLLVAGAAAWIFFKQRQATVPYPATNNNPNKSPGACTNTLRDLGTLAQAAPDPRAKATGLAVGTGAGLLCKTAPVAANLGKKVFDPKTNSLGGKATFAATYPVSAQVKVGKKAYNKVKGWLS
jgi:hypothetical protein